MNPRIAAATAQTFLSAMVLSFAVMAALGAATAAVSSAAPVKLVTTSNGN